MSEKGCEKGANMRATIQLEGSQNALKINPKIDSKIKCVLASIFARFWSILGGKLGSKWLQKSLQKRIEKTMQIQMRFGCVLGGCSAARALAAGPQPPPYYTI